MSPITACRICGNTHLVQVLSLGEQFLTGVFPHSRDERITCGPLELVKCHGENACSLLQLAHSYDSAEMYGANYGYRSGLNQSMVSHLRGKVENLLRVVSVRARDVVLDIGSNDGTLLSCYPEGPALIGMDPTAAKFISYYQERIKVIPDFFSADLFLSQFEGRKAKVITSIAMLYDLENPISFVRQIASVLDPDGIWHFEQSYMPSMLKVNAYDTVCHEHVEYYGLKQIQWMLDRCGLKIIDVEINDVNGGSFAVTAAHVSSRFDSNSSTASEALHAETALGLETLAPYEAFAKRVAKHRDDLRAKLAEIAASGGRVLGYGASTKGNVILQYCGLSADDIPAIAEVNPDKFGAFTPGTRIPIISEEEAHARKPDYFLVMPWHFRENLLAREKAFLEGGGKMLFPLPAIEVVSR
ncbi:MAG: class I SAM-dependent methyltransferase [Verrucomicrobiota bacterium]